MNSKRLYFVFAFIFLLAGIMSWRLFEHQVISGGNWKAQAQGQQMFFYQTEGERGEIYLQNKKGDLVPLAINRTFFHAYISPKEIAEEDRENIAREISEALNIEERVILERMMRDSSYELLKRKISDEEISIAREIDKLYLESDVMRYYPQGDFASHIVGFVGGEQIGQYGVEQYYESVMGGREGLKEGRKSPKGFFITRDTTERGASIILTVDYNIQHFTEKLLYEASEAFDISEGSIIVGDPNTGEIIALANFPSFDPNRYSQENDFYIFKNKAIQSFFEPGSIFKPITMAAALDAMAVDHQDTYIDKGYVHIHNRTIYNYGRRAWGEVTMTNILENSINTGIVEVEKRIGHELFLEYLRKFGIFEATGIDLHGEVFSANRNILEMYDVNFANASFGQGIQITTMQMFRAFSALANGGKMITPHIVKGMGHPPGEPIISSRSASRITSMLVSVVDNGSGWRAKVPGYYVAGKTGTAQIPWSVLGIQKSGYSSETIQSFIGYAPAFNPRFLIIVRLDKPNARTSELSAAPIFSELSKYILDYMQIAPDYYDKTTDKE